MMINGKFNKNKLNFLNMANVLIAWATVYVDDNLRTFIITQLETIHHFVSVKGDNNSSMLLAKSF